MFMQGRPRQAAHDSALVVAVFLHVREVVLQGWVRGLVVVTKEVIGKRDFSVPGLVLLVLGFFIDELALVLDEIFFFGVLVEAVAPDRGPTPVQRPPPEQGPVAPVPAHVDLVLGEPHYGLAFVLRHFLAVYLYRF